MSGRSTAPKAAEEEEAEAASHAEMIPSSLPTGPGFPPYAMRLYRGFWLSERCLKALAPTHARFKPRPTDVLLASFPKSGTTWLKALAFCVRNRAAHPPSAAADHPLHRGNPHDLVGFLENSPDLLLVGANANSNDDDELYAHLPSPRLLATHLPYSLLPLGITDMQCKILYVCRDPKDTLVSFWHFHQKTRAVLQQVPGVGVGSTTMPTFQEAFETYCQGRSVAGPQWRHVLEYWEASRRPGGPDHVMFLRYEDMVRDPEGNLRSLAAFMGCPFSPEEEAAGVARDVVELCRLGTLKALEVNRSGSTVLGLQNEAFFRNGTVGDWRSCLTPAMAARLDGIVADAFRGTGFTFGSSSADNTS